MENYEELEGKKVKYISSCGYKANGIVKGCDYDIGITIMNEVIDGSETDYLLCLRGPSSPLSEFVNPKHDIYFNSIVTQIKEGVVDDDKLTELIGCGECSNPDNETCSFSQ